MDSGGSPSLSAVSSVPSHDDLDIDLSMRHSKSLSDLRLDYRQWRTGSHVGADMDGKELTTPFDSTSPSGIVAHSPTLVGSPPFSFALSANVKSPSNGNERKNTIGSGLSMALSRATATDEVGSSLQNFKLSSSPDVPVLPQIPEKQDENSPSPPNSTKMCKAEENARKLSIMLQEMDHPSTNHPPPLTHKLSSSFDSGTSSNSNYAHNNENEAYDANVGTRRRERSLSGAGGMIKSTSYTGLNDLEKLSTFFPAMPKSSASGVQRGLKDSVINDMCRAIVKQIVGDLYVLSATGGEKIVNHLYQPMFESVQKHFQMLPARYALSVNPDNVPMHMRLIAQHRRNPTEIAINAYWVIEDDGSTSDKVCEVVVVSEDRDNLLDGITRALTSQRGSIMDADVITTKHGLVIDRFTVRGNFVDEKNLAALKEKIHDNLNAGQSGEDDETDIQEALTRRINSFEDSSGRVRREWELDMKEIILEAPIGAGRSGQTYLARWRGARVAAKVITAVTSSMHSPSDGGDGNEILDEFNREVAVVSRLRHPNIVLFIGVAVQIPTYCLLFEFMENGTLTNHLRSSSKKHLIDFFQISTQIALGMNYLHLCSILHRDLKSGNILIDHHGTVKVSDFGLSCVLEGDASAEMTAETGTYRWMAPEVIRHEPYSNKADVYSYGVVLWEMITKEQPFRGMTPIQAAFAVARQQMRPALPQYTPFKLGELVEHCWHQDPNERPSFSEILDVLPLVQVSLKKRDFAQFHFVYKK